MKKKILAFIMILGVMISSNTLLKKADAANSKSIFESLQATKSLEKLDTSSPNMTIIHDDSSSNLPNLLNSKNKDILSLYGVTTKNVKSVKTVKDNRNPRTFTEVKLNNKSTVGFDSDNQIISISNFKNNDQLKLQSSLPNKVNSDADLSDFVKKVETFNNLKNDYKLVSSEPFDKEEGDYWQLIWERKYENGILNRYDSIKVFVDRKDKSVVAYNRFRITPNTTQPVISENEALTSAQSVLDIIPNIKNKTVSLTTTRPNFFWNDNGGYEEADFVRLAYKINVNDSYEIYIDAVTGENLGGTISLAAGGKAFGSQQVVWEASGYVTLARNAMDDLGWDASSYVSDDESVGREILNWWNSSNAYAFYVMCHGNEAVLADNSTWTRNIDEVSGNWYFVYLDACSSAANNNWANAFKTIGYSNRGFLGWNEDVWMGASWHFDQQFWPELVNGTHSNNIRDAAVWAAGQVTEYTPIRYKGDRYYNGRAHS